MPTCGRAQLAAEQIGRAAKVEQRRQARGAERRADRAVAPGAAEAVDDDHARLDAGPRRKPCADLPAGTVAVLRQQQHVMIVAGDVRGVDAGIGEHGAVAVRDHQHAFAVPHDLGRLAKDQLDQPRVLVDLGGKLRSRAAKASRSRRSTIRPSAFDTIFCAITTMSPRRSDKPELARP